MSAAGGNHAFDAIVVGAGIVGAACAHALAAEGFRVLIIDAAYPAGGTTAAGMGHLVAMDDSPAQLALTALSVQLWRELSRALPPNVEYEPCGTIWVAVDDEQLAAVHEKRAVYAAAGVHSEVLSPADVADLEPHLRPGLAGGLLVTGDSVVYQPRATLWLLEQAQRLGAVVRRGVRADAITDHAVRCGDEVLRAGIVVNAAGAEAARLTPEIPVVPRKGHLAITDRYPGFVRHQLVELGYLTSAHTMSAESVAFNVQPRATHQVLIGSSRELVGWDASTNRRILRRMLDRAVEFMPDLSRLAVIRTWTGFRPATPDKLPLIGPWPRTAGLWVAAGHEGLGITTSLATAAILRDQITGRRPAIDPAPFLPGRVLEGSVAAHT